MNCPLQLFTQLEFSINPDYLSVNYETTKEHLGTQIQCFGADDNDTAPVLPWIPTTTAAVGFRLMEFDASMCYMPQQKMEREKDEEADKFAVSISLGCKHVTLLLKLGRHYTNSLFPDRKFVLQDLLLVRI